MFVVVLQWILPLRRYVTSVCCCLAVDPPTPPLRQECLLLSCSGSSHTTATSRVFVVVLQWILPHRRYVTSVSPSSTRRRTSEPPAAATRHPVPKRHGRYSVSDVTLIYDLDVIISIIYRHDASAISWQTIMTQVKNAWSKSS